MNSKREAWVDYIKVVACILVVLSHFIQSMVKASILPEGTLFKWFDTTMYYFHVPLFFICSGYLYQRYSKVDSWKNWTNNIWKKITVLGVPYFVFSLLTWVIKTVFADATSNAIGGVWDTLFINPYPPYWYLYILFLIFFFTPTVGSSVMLYILVSIALGLKIVCCLNISTFFLNIYAIQGVMSNEIWFILGMCIASVSADRLKHRMTGLILLATFIGLSILTVKLDNGFIDFLMGVLACTAVFMIMVQMKENSFFKVLAPYTMPVFLMHTLMAAPVRIAMIKAGIYNPVLHVVIGLLVSVLGPIIAFKLMQKAKLDFFVFPGKYIKKKV